MTATTNLIVAGGDSLSQQVATAVASGAMSVARNRCVLFGDSITAYNTATASNALANQARGYMTWANILLGERRLEVVSNLGVGGDTTAQMLARINSVLAVDAEYVVVLGGSNELLGNYFTIDTVTSNLTAIYELLRAAGRKVIAVSTLPVTAAHPNYTQQAATRVRAVGNWIADYCRSHAGMIYVDGMGAVLDTTSSGLVPTTGYFADSTHPGVPGAYAIGKAIKTTVYNLIPPLANGPSSVGDSYLAAQRTLTSLTGTGVTATATLAAHGLLVGDPITIEGATPAGYNGSWIVTTVPTTGTFTYACTASGAATGTIKVSNSDQILDNPLFGTPSAGLASSWTIIESSTTSTPTTSSRTDGKGNWQQLSVTSSGASAFVTLQGGDHITRVFSGDTIVFECEIECDATPVNLEGIQLELNCIAGGTVYTAIANYRLTGSTAPNEAWSGVLRTEPLTLSGAITRCRPKALAYFSAAGNAVFRVGRAKVIKIR